VETDPWHGNWKYTISSESHLEKLTVLFCHIFSSRAIFPCVLSIGDKHKGNFLKSSLRWARKWSHMLGFTSSHKFLAFARIGIWGLYVHVLVVAVAQTCETSAWVSVVYKKFTNVKYGQWQRQHVDSFLITVPHDSWWHLHCCPYSFTPVQVISKGNSAGLSNTQCLHSTTMNLESFGLQ
jgi:hypothetical protein